MTNPKDENLNDEMNELQEEINEIEENEEREENEVEQNETDVLKEEVASLKESLVRKQADYQNFQARVERDKVEMTHFITQKILLKILPTVDNLERILAATPDTEKETALYKGLESTLKSLQKELTSMGVEAYSSLGEEVDPDRHDVMSQVPGEEGKIVNEFEKGYTMNGKVVRHAKVVVWMGA